MYNNQDYINTAMYALKLLRVDPEIICRFEEEYFFLLDSCSPIVASERADEIRDQIAAH